MHRRFQLKVIILIFGIACIGIFFVTFFSTRIILKGPLEITDFSYEAWKRPILRRCDFKIYVKITNRGPTKLTNITITIVFSEIRLWAEPWTFLPELGSKETHEWTHEGAIGDERAPYYTPQAIVKCSEGYIDSTFPWYIFFIRKWWEFSYLFPWYSLGISILAVVVFIIPSWLTLAKRKKQFESEQKKKGLVKYKGRWGTPKEVQQWKEEEKKRKEEELKAKYPQHSL